jgi:hypothetical protein
VGKGKSVSPKVSPHTKKSNSLTLCLPSYEYLHEIIPAKTRTAVQGGLQDKQGASESSTKETEVRLAAVALRCKKVLSTPSPSPTCPPTPPLRCLPLRAPARYSRALVAHACNPSYLGDRDWEDSGLKAAWANSSVRLSRKTLHKNRAVGVTQNEGPAFKPQFPGKKWWHSINIS